MLVFHYCYVCLCILQILAQIVIHLKYDWFIIQMFVYFSSKTMNFLWDLQFSSGDNITRFVIHNELPVTHRDRRSSNFWCNFNTPIFCNICFNPAHVLILLKVGWISLPILNSLCSLPLQELLPSFMNKDRSPLLHLIYGTIFQFIFVKRTLLIILKLCWKLICLNAHICDVVFFPLYYL